MQAGRSPSPIPRFFELNQGPGYIPFLITNNQGHNIPAKYISVHMTANPYALRKLKSDGPTKWGEIHAASRYDYAHVMEYSNDNLRKLLCQEAALTRRTSWRRSRGGVGLGLSVKC